MTEYVKIYDHPFGVKEYSYPMFSKTEMDSYVDHLENMYFCNPKMCDPDRPGVQTMQRLFDDYKFKKLHDTFMESVRLYINDEEMITCLSLDRREYLEYTSWCYVNWKSDTYDEPGGWHSHNEHGYPRAISGIFYLKLPEGTGEETIFNVGGNYFHLPSNEWSWFIFPSTFLHCPGNVYSPDKRYVISADISFTKDCIK